MSINWNIARDDFMKILLVANTEKAISFSADMLQSGATPSDFFEMCISPVLKEIGHKFETLEIFLPEMVSAADVVQAVNDQVISPAVDASETDQISSAGKVLMATVQGDLHDIGKNMVALMLNVNGFEVIDLGTNVAPSEIVVRAENEEVDIIGMSSLLTTCLPYMKDVYDYLEGKDIRDKYGVIIGGAAITLDFADDVGADGYGQSAAEAVVICQKIMKSK